MIKDLRSGKPAPGPLLVAAIVALVLVAGAATHNRRALAATDEAAATARPTATPKPRPTPKPVPTPTVNASTSITGAVLCRGTIGATADSTDLPAADMYMEMTFFSGSPATLPTAKKPVAVTGLYLMAINASCPSGFTGEGPPCAHQGEFYGSITLSTNGGPDPMTLTFNQSGDVLNGCQASFQVLPYSKSTQAYFVSTAPISQDPAPSAATCGAIDTSIVVACQEINS